jgi:hypothetical protein
MKSLNIFSLVAIIQAQPLLAYCPPLGPILPASEKLLSNTDFQQVVAAINEQLADLTTSYNETALSLGVRSLHDCSPILSFHHTPSIFNISGVHEVDGDTVYRIASVTKLFTAVSVLQLEGKVNLAESIAKYVPDLLNISSAQTGLSSVDWSTITVESLLSQLSGIEATSRLAIDRFWATV